MDEQTITDADVQPEAGAQEALPVENAEQSAATEPAEPTTETTGAEEALPEVDDKLKSFAKGQGIEDISQLNEREQKLLKIAYDNNAEFQRTRQKQSQLEKTLRTDLDQAAASGDTELVQQLAMEVQSLKLTQSVTNFFEASDVPAEKRDAVAAERRALEPVMVNIVTDDPVMGQLVREGHISYERLYQMAKGADNGRDDKLKQDGGREALRKVAEKTSAKAVAGSATTADMSPADKKDPFLAAFDSSSS